MKQFIFGLLALLALACKSSKYPSYDVAQNMKTRNMVTIPELINADIPGAPVLSQPVHIQGTINEIMTEKHGYAYPALYDWDKDGLKDLLIGEFETGKSGSFLQIHLNEGSNEHPVFTGDFEYAKDLQGDTITAYYWCCIGLHPRFVDLTGDGIDDLVTGSYNPGIITMWEGTNEGFKPAMEVDQEGDPRKYINGLPLTDNRSMDYWNYSSANFADFNNDGLYDLFVAGSGGLRVALNIGSKTKPKFGYRQLLLDPEGQALLLMDKEQMDQHEEKYGSAMCISGDMKSYIEPVDWDGDGVLDLLATSTYSYEGQNPVEFFRGVQTPKGLRFEQRVPLFKRKDGQPRPLPGSGTQVKVEDYNNDGVKDLLLGVSIISVDDYQIVDSLAWQSLDHHQLPRIGKDLGHGYGDPKRHKETMEMQKKMAEWYPGSKIPWYYQRELDDEVLDIYSSRHRGYVYVMYGQKPASKAQVKEYTNAKDFVLAEKYQLKTKEKASHQTKEVKVAFEATENPSGYDTPMVIKVKFTMKPGWYLYADTKHNRDDGYFPTTIEFETCKGVVVREALKTPVVSNPEGTGRYEGLELEFEQVFNMTREYYGVKADDKKIKATVKYQTCNQDMCLPPVTVEEVIAF
jgi:hypothetical protein